MLKVSKILKATPPPLETQKSRIYYHGIRQCTETLAHQILNEGLKHVPTEFWAKGLEPQEAVYLTTDLGVALAYTAGHSDIDGWYDFLNDVQPYGKVYVAAINGRELYANIEVDEDELNEYLEMLRHLGEDELGKWSRADLDFFNLWKSKGFPDAKDFLKELPKQYTYWFLTASDWSRNLAHHGPLPVFCIYTWDLKDLEKAETSLRQSYYANSPIGAQVMR